jgi:microcystin degradation protein MlrC
MRVGIIALHHESNTFLAKPTTLADFEADVLGSGEAMRATFENAHHEVGGFFAGLSEEQIEAVPIVAARAMPSGVITAEAANELVSRALDELNRAGTIDGLLLAAHGAAVSENERDFDGYWLARVRQTVGPEMPIVGTLDLHANISPRMIAACDATIAYRTNPHLDQRQRGIGAAKLLARTLRGEVRPTQALATPPIAINIERQLTAESPCRELYAFADKMLARPRVLSNSCVLGFPYADVAEMGSSFIVVTDYDPALAQRLADELASYLIDRRRDFVPKLISVARAIDEALNREPPVCLLDVGDNVGGGSPGDGTILIAALHVRGAGPAAACIFDPQAVEHARVSGVGKTITISVGAKTDRLHGEPLSTKFGVLGLSDGKFEEAQPRHGGKTRFDMGPCAVVQTLDGVLTLLLMSRRTPPFSLNQLTSCGIDPGSFRILIAKGVHAPVAAYRTVCKSFIRVNTPGVTTADMALLPYRHRRKPLFPLEEVG